MSFKVFSGTYLWSAPSVIVSRGFVIMDSLVDSTGIYETPHMCPPLF